MILYTKTWRVLGSSAFQVCGRGPRSRAIQGVWLIDLDKGCQTDVLGVKWRKISETIVFEVILGCL